MRSPSSDNVRNAIDLSHHLSTISKARHPSALKALIHHMATPGMISLGGGMPHPTTFPFQQTTVTILPPSGSVNETIDFTLPKFASEPGQLDLATLLQYGSGEGHKTLRDFGAEFTKLVYEPAYADYQVLMNNGNTDSWAKVVKLLCEQGDYLITESHCFSSAQGVWIPLGIRAVPIAMDSEGMRSDSLKQHLSEWETTHPGVKRPHVMYITPVGSNPTGTTMGAVRRQEIYDICVEYDIIIVEDDPYTVLQYPDYVIGADTDKVAALDPEDFRKSLVPSFLKFDYQGRVIRLDTYSKTIAPGSRLGYFVANPLFTERLLRATEVETQAASGLSQGFLSTLLHTWGLNGYLSWLSQLRDQYQVRRNWICSSLAKSFNLVPASSTIHANKVEGLIAFPRGSNASLDSTKPIFSFVPPTGGMFIWSKFYLRNSPLFVNYADKEDPEAAFMDYIFDLLTEEKVLLVQGKYYVPWQGADKATTASRGDEPGVGYFRLAFSTASPEELDEAAERIRKVVEKVWGVDAQ